MNLFTSLRLDNQIGSVSFYYNDAVFKNQNDVREVALLRGSLSFAFGLLVIGSMFGVQSLGHSRIEQWVEVHDEHFTPSSFPDVHEIRGSIDIKPGRTLSLELTLDVSVDTNQDGDFVLFSLNPGYKISHLEVAGEKVNDHEFLHGLLKIPVKYFNSDRTEMGIVAKGYPDKRFAYLDSRDTLSQMVGPAVRQLRQLGTENSIFHSKFVVLQPGIKWYPTAGTATNEGAWERRKKDFFALDIEVSVPHNWLVAGPAKRELSEQNKRTTYSFKQSSPLPEFALVGSRFESASVEVEGIAFELLYTKVHRRKFEPFAQYGDAVRQWIKWRLDTVHPKGFYYPYGSFVLVEVPSNLRVFGGDVEMDTVMNPPGIVMIRESTLPTTTIKSWFKGSRQEVMEELGLTDERFNGIVIGSIGGYLTHPLFESNVHLGLSQSLLTQQTSATGEGARALNTLLDLLTSNLSNYFRAPLLNPCLG